MSLREEQCNKVCRILDDVLANRPTERDSLILAVRKAFAEPHSIKVNQGQSSDMISRQAAIDAIDTLFPKTVESDFKQGFACGVARTRIEVKNLPTAEPERKGKWIDINGDGSLYECDQCHDKVCCKGNYCPNCGAHMIGVEHG